MIPADDDRNAAMLARLGSMRLSSARSMGTASSTPLPLAADRALLQITQLACVRWKNELATTPVRHSVRHAIVVERAIPANAEIGLEAAFG
jgi:hypothetical protein